MAEGQFLMQRYYGSDEEIDQVNDIISRKTNNVKTDTAQPKKMKLKCSDLNEANETIDDEICTDRLEQNGTVVQISDTQKIISVETQNAFIEKDPRNTNQKKKKSQKSNIQQDNSSLPTNAAHSISISKQNFNANTIDIKDSKTIKDSNTNKENSDNFCVIGQKKGQTLEYVKPALPKWLSNPAIIKINLKDHEIPISELQYIDCYSKKNLTESGIKFLFPVQLAIIPWLMQANQHCLFIRPSDLCVSAPTGSGKTLAFVIPIVQSLRSRVVSAIRAIIVLPVSELAIQVYKVFEMFIKGTDLKVVLLTGQKSFTTEQNALIKQGIHKTLSLADIVVTTPGRILDHIHKTEGFCLEHVRYLVIDEADRMMEDIQKGWLKQVEDAVYKDNSVSGCVCFSTSRKRMLSGQSTACSFGYVNQPLQKLMYSATLSHDPEKLHALSLFRPKLFITQESNEWIGKCPLPENLITQYVICESEIKPIVLCHYLRNTGFNKILCFTESIERAQRLNLVLEEMGFFRSREMSSNFRPVQRKIVLEQFCSGKVDILVCSDLVARGIDIEDVDCVVSYDAPLFLKTYVHRIGRTARAGKKGVAVALMTENELPHFKQMVTSAGMSMPTAVSINAKDLEDYVGPFQKALQVADEKLRKLKSDRKKKTFKKRENDDQRQTRK